MGEAKKRLLVIALLVSACGGAVEPSTVAVEETPSAVPSASPTADADASGLSPIPVDSVPIGSCFNENRGPTTDRIFAVVVPCDGPHQLEMIGSAVLPEGWRLPIPAQRR